MIALLDDVAAIAKLAAASLDDIAGQTATASAKAAGIVIDDAAVAPNYVVGVSPAREFPIILKITLGSLRNKLIFLLPAALLLGYFAPWAITPLLMLGGAYLSYEGAEKVLGAIKPHHGGVSAETTAVAADPKTLEDEKVQSAIKTDFILSAEIMAFTLASIPAGSIWVQAVIMALVAILITLAVYGVVALIVKADDLGLALAGNRDASFLGSIGRGTGRGLVKTMPILLKLLGIVGTAAMIWVGGGIIIHGLEVYGLPALGHAIETAAETVTHPLPAGGSIVAWIVKAAASGIVGLALGALLIPLATYGLAPIARALKGRRGQAV
ncbi:hypothetical protein SAMN07250955_11535 [Arboricoccus pini]|uniref:Inner membrane protein YedI n=1 Tax=Arboricoccus pini TaxID=1963835 RepID=A0A212RV10_9PROT|nr:hypothetical protein SAMN07250955_11535 [Arboricoccus pini]